VLLSLETFFSSLSSLFTEHLTGNDAKALAWSEQRETPLPFGPYKKGWETQSLHKKFSHSTQFNRASKMSIEQKRVESRIKVLHLSMPRTGSLSMKAAYKELGLEMYHGFDFMDRRGDQLEWTKAIDAKFDGKGKPYGRKEFDAFLGQWDVLSDFPVIGFTDELLEAYPDVSYFESACVHIWASGRRVVLPSQRLVNRALTYVQAKVVLVDRDITSWFKSFDSQVIAASFTRSVWVLKTFIEPFMTSKVATTILKMEYGLFNCHDQESFSRNAKATYLDHYAKVRRIVPRERLLDYQLGSGWKPLCEFLGKPIPNKEFPHLNETKAFAVWMRNIQRRELNRGLRFMGKFLLVPLLMLGVFWYFRRYGSQ
jgi:hypothetical protein